MSANQDVHQGGCSCAKVRYELRGEPMIVHACHCTQCQRRTGSAYAVNLWIEAKNVVVTAGELHSKMAPGGDSGQPSESWFCPDCGTCVWTYFHSAPKNSRFIRAGTLDDPSVFAPDVHIFTQSRQAWTDIPDGVATFEAFYDLKETWRPESLTRLKTLIESAHD